MSDLGFHLNYKRCFCSRNLNDLSDHLLELILKWLPVNQTFSRRDVCKKWKVIMSSPSFQCVGKPWILRRLTNQKDSQEDKVYFMAQPLKSLHGYLEMCIDFTGSLKGLGAGWVGDTAQGLVCFHPLCYSSTAPNIVVANPLNKTWRILPNALQQCRSRPEDRYSIHVIDLKIRVYESGFYKVWIIAIMNPDIRRKSQRGLLETWISVYDSLSHTWGPTTRYGKPVLQLQTTCLKDDSLFLFAKKCEKITVTKIDPPSQEHAGNGNQFNELNFRAQPAASSNHSFKFSRIFRFMDRVLLHVSREGINVGDLTECHEYILHEFDFCTLSWKECSDVASENWLQGGIAWPFGMPHQDIHDDYWLSSTKQCEATYVAKFPHPICLQQLKKFEKPRMLPFDTECCIYEPRMDTQA